jgi:tetratricopeptide (TPR) repeat protein
LRNGDVRKGTFIAAVGADSHDKQELDPELLFRGKIVADIVSQSATIGDFHHAIQAGLMKQEDAYGELGEIVAGKAGLELDPNSFLSYRAITLACTGLKKYDEAIESAEHLIKISNRHPHALSDLMKVYSETGKTEENKILMHELRERSQHEFIDAVYMAFAAAYTGNLDEAFTYLDTAFIERDPALIAIRHVRSYSKPLSEDPRYETILQRMAFP